MKKLGYAIIAIATLSSLALLIYKPSHEIDIRNDSGENGQFALNLLQDKCNNIIKYGENIKSIHIENNKYISIFSWNKEVSINIKVSQKLSNAISSESISDNNLVYSVGRGHHKAGISAKTEREARFCEWSIPLSDDHIILPIHESFPESFKPSTEEKLNRDISLFCLWRRIVRYADSESDKANFSNPSDVWNIGDIITIEVKNAFASREEVSQDKSRSDLVRKIYELKIGSKIEILDKDVTYNILAGTGDHPRTTTHVNYKIHSTQYPGQKFDLKAGYREWFDTDARMARHQIRKNDWKNNYLSQMEEKIFTAYGEKREDILLRGHQEGWSFKTQRGTCYS